MLHSIFFMVTAIVVGYVAFLIIYWKQEHAIVKFGFGVLNDIELFIILAIVGLVLSFLG